MTIPTLPDVLHVEVTDDDIARGRRLNGRRCPIARAVRRLGYRGVTVCDELVLKQGPNHWVEYRLPFEAAAFMWRFDTEPADRKGPVEPFAFTTRLWDTDAEPPP